MPERTIQQAATAKKGGFLQRKTWRDGSFRPRVDAIATLVTDKSVLDLGCASARNRPDWVHGQIAALATSTVGVDLDRAAVEELVDRGFDVRFGDAETFRIDEQFDVVFAGEIIEHLDCFKGLFETARAHLKEGGVLVLTTPNAFAFSNFVYRIAGEVKVNGDHTCWFCETTLQQLIERQDFSCVQMRYLHFTSPGRLRGPIAGAVRRVLPERLAWSTLIAVAQPNMTQP